MVSLTNAGLNISVIRIPYTDLATMIEFTFDQWPVGTQLKSDDALFRNKVLNAAAYLAMDLIVQDTDSSAKTDPAVRLLSNMGYPISEIDQGMCDELIALFDDVYLDVIIAFEPFLKNLRPMISDMAYTMSVCDEDIILSVMGNKWKLKYDNAARSLKSIKRNANIPVIPTEITELEQLDPIEQYIDRTIGRLLTECNNPAVLDEVKRLVSQCLNRY